MKQAAILFLAASALLAQSPVDGPVTGWVWDSSHGAIRPILGLPGASVLGNGVDGGVIFSKAVTNQRNYVIGIGGEGAQAYLLRLRGESQAELLPSVAAGVSRVVLSPSGDSAVLVYEETRKLVVLSGLPDAITEPREIQWNEIPSALAISDHASYLAAASENGVVIIDRDGNRWNPGQERAAASLAFLDGSSDLLVADEAGVWLVRNVQNPERTLLFDQPARAVASTRDRGQVVAITTDAKLRVIDMATHASRELQAPVEPAKLARLSGAVFGINESGSEPLWLLDLQGTEPRTVFVPADPKSTDQ